SQLTTRYLGVFGQSIWKLTPNLLLTAAVRWQEEEKHVTIANSVTAPGASLISAVLTPATLPDGQAVNGQLRRNSHNVPWSLTPQYRFGDDKLLYVSDARRPHTGA